MSVKKKLKEFGKVGLGMTTTGIGLGYAASLEHGGYGSGLTKALPIAGSIASAGMTMGMIGELNKATKIPKKKRKKKKY